MIFKYNRHPERLVAILQNETFFADRKFPKVSDPDRQIGKNVDSSTLTFWAGPFPISGWPDWFLLSLCVEIILNLTQTV